MEQTNIIAMIAEAEQEALAKKTQAQEEAARIVTEAQKRAMEISKASELDCAKLTQEILEQAKKQSEIAYEEELSAKKQSAASYADGVLEHVQPQVADIVGRILK